MKSLLKVEFQLTEDGLNELEEAATLQNTTRETRNEVGVEEEQEQLDNIIEIDDEDDISSEEEDKDVHHFLKFTSLII